MHHERDPLYRETAHFIIETGRPSVPTLVNMILMQLDSTRRDWSIQPLLPSPVEPRKSKPRRSRRLGTFCAPYTGLMDAKSRLRTNGARWNA